MYSKINRKILTEEIRTITLDIFDTVLLRKIWPENLQFYLVAKKWLPFFHKYFSSGLTVAELYSYRIYTRNELISIHREYNTPGSKQEYDVNLRIWFSKIVNLLSLKHNVKMTKSQTDALVTGMIEAELTTEEKNLVPNLTLIQDINRLKHEHPKLRVYFVSDMYLSHAEINRLLSHFEIGIFDGGVVSNEVGYTKGSGRLYDYLHSSKILGHTFDLAHNLHIGDNEISDFHRALSSGSDAILYHKPRLRRLPI